MTANKASAIAAKQKRLDAEWRDRQGATFRTFWYACKREIQPGTHYEQGEEAREGWRKKAEVSAKALGLTS